MKELDFIDLFSGIGAFHLAMDEFNHHCVLSSEIDTYAIQTYLDNFNINSDLNIRDIDEKDVPNHDILCGGFPCFVAGTKILTKSGYKNIEDIKINEEVFTQKRRFRKVLTKFVSNNKEIWKVTKKNKKSIFVTKNHPILIFNTITTNYEYKKVEDLSLNKDKICTFSNFDISQPKNMDYVIEDIIKIENLHIYEKVYNLEVEDDNTYIANEFIVHNCQTFSIAGKGLGFLDKTRGTLFFEIARILKEKHPKYIILENVKNLVNHNNGKTYQTIIDTLKDIGYILPKEPIIMSPIQLGIPQNRERVFILGIYKDFYDKEYLEINIPPKQETSIYSILDEKVSSKYNISFYEEKVMNAWDEFHKKVPNHYRIVWVNEFGETYDYSNLPKWKQNYIKHNRQLYLENKEFIDAWIKKYEVNNFKLRDKKLEWNAGTSISSIWDGLIQFRQSGVRVKAPNYFQTLVAVGQIPIIGKYKRRLTPREAARLQSFPEDYKLNSRDDKAYKQLGNSANVEVIKYLASQLFSIGNDK